MALLSDKDAQEIRKLFEDLDRDVHVTVFTRELECDSCTDTEMIMKELEPLSDRLKVTVYNQMVDEDKAEEFGVDRVPAIFVSDGSHSRVRFFGTPSGYEFSSLLTTVLDAGSSEDSLSPETLDFLSGLKEDLDINVFVTPTCPYCPPAAVLATRMAAACENVVASVVEANEFPDLAAKYRVQGVPRSVVNERFFAEGTLQEPQLIRALTKALSEGAAEGPIDLMGYLAE